MDDENVMMKLVRWSVQLRCFESKTQVNNGSRNAEVDEQ